MSQVDLLFLIVVFPEVPIVDFKRRKSLEDLLVRAKAPMENLVVVRENGNKLALFWKKITKRPFLLIKRI